MTNVACFCGCAYSFDGGEGPCPKRGAVAVVGTKAIHKTSGNNEQSEPDAATAGAPHALQGGRRPYMTDLQGFATARGASHG
jgi:hypothetical protein